MHDRMMNRGRFDWWLGIGGRGDGEGFENFSTGGLNRAHRDVLVVATRAWLLVDTAGVCERETEQ